MKYSILILSALLICIALVDVSCRSDNHRNIIGLKQNIQHDDFEYSVTSFTKTPEIIAEKDTVFAKDMFYLVHFKVVNNALRVGHKWDSSIAYLIDEKGKHYENIEENQDLLNKSLPFGLKKFYNTPNGASDSTILVFNLPADVKEPYLMVRGGTLMGDVFNSGRFRKIKVKLF